MLNRRTFASLLAGTAILPRPVRAQQGVGKIAFYAAVGAEMVAYDLDVQAATLTKSSSVTLPGGIQYAWPHPSKKHLYVGTSKGRSGGADGISALTVDPATGALSPHGQPAALQWSPVHLSIDHTGDYVLVAYFNPPHASVHRLNADGTLGEEVQQAEAPDTGHFSHQIRATPTNKTVTLVTRGSDPTPREPETPGAIKVFEFHDGQLAKLASVAPGDGMGFGPRHLDFHPSAPFVYVSLERENSLFTYGIGADGVLTPAPLFTRTSLVAPDNVHTIQQAGPIHVHPNGRFVYQANRSSGMVDFGDRHVAADGENNIAVFAINPGTGEPTPIQHAPPHGFEIRSFAIDPAGKVLIAAAQHPMLVREGDTVTTVTAGLVVYRIGADGTLAFQRKYDVDTSAGQMLWCGLLTMA